MENKPNNKPKMLFLSPSVPLQSAGGTSLRLCKFIAALSKEFSIHLVICIPEDYTFDEQDVLSGYTQSVEIIRMPAVSNSEGFVNSLRGVLFNLPFSFHHQHLKSFLETVKSKYQPDIVFAVKCSMAAQMIESGLIQHFRNTPMIIDEAAVHYLPYLRDAQYDREFGKRLRGFIRYCRLYEFSKKMARLFDRVIVVSRDEIKMVEKFLPRGQISFVPNGMDCFELSKTFNGDCLIMGPYQYSPNEHGIRWFFDQVYPSLIKNGFTHKIYIVGSNPPKFINDLAQKDDRIVVKGFIERLEDIYALAGIVLCPMWKGGGTRTKVLEAMSFGKAIVTTSIGCEGIDAQHEEQMLIRDTPQDFAQAVLSLSDNEQKIKELGKSARLCIEQKYQWDDILDPLTSEALDLAKT